MREVHKHKGNIFKNTLVYLSKDYIILCYVIIIRVIINLILLLYCIKYLIRY